MSALKLTSTIQCTPGSWLSSQPNDYFQTSFACKNQFAGTWESSI